MRRPFAGAWIETRASKRFCGRLWSRPFAGAWIETVLKRIDWTGSLSPLRGGVDRNRDGGVPSATIDGRPFAGAWIETRYPMTLRRIARSPLRGGVDRNRQAMAFSAGRACRPFAGAWIETARGLCGSPRNERSPLRGGVDRNALLSQAAAQGSAVAPSRGRGSKRIQNRTIRKSRGSPLRGGVDRNSGPTPLAVKRTGRPFAGAWIETAARPRVRTH